MDCCSQLLGVAPVAAMALAFGAAFATFQFRQPVKDCDNSVTSTVAGRLVFALGFYSVIGETVVAAAVAVAGTILLAFKEVIRPLLSGPPLGMFLDGMEDHDGKEAEAGRDCREALAG